MSDTIVDVMLHIDEALTYDQLTALRKTVLQIGGVMTASVNEKNPHLIILEYDPDLVSSTSILKAVNDSGLHAKLIGL